MKLPTLAQAVAFVSEAKKAVVGVVGMAALLVATGALTGNVLHIAQGIVAFGTVLGIYKAQNGPAPIVYTEADSIAQRAA